MQTPQNDWWDPVPGAADPRAEEAELAKIPSLAKPFAAFGAAAGFFAILALGSFREAAREVSPLVPMIVTAAAGALVGVTLRRWRRLHSPALAREAVILWLAIIVGLAGAASGGVVGLYTWGVDGFTRFAAGGIVAGLVFVPSCLVVFEAARRAGRGRHGSLVSATDARTVASTVLAGIAFAGATQVPAVLSANVSNDLEPILQVVLSVAVCLGATIAIVVLQRLDRKARAALEVFAKDAAWLDRAPEGEVLPPAAVDLGIGAEQWTRIDRRQLPTQRTGGRPGERLDQRRHGGIRRVCAAPPSFAHRGRMRPHRRLGVVRASPVGVPVIRASEKWKWLFQPLSPTMRRRLEMSLGIVVTGAAIVGLSTVIRPDPSKLRIEARRPGTARRASAQRSCEPSHRRRRRWRPNSQPPWPMAISPRWRDSTPRAWRSTACSPSRRESGDMTVTRWLLDHGADVHEDEDSVDAPVLLADEHPDIVALLLERGAIEPSLATAAHAGAPSAVSRLLSAHAQVNVVNPTEGSPLHVGSIVDEGHRREQEAHRRASSSPRAPSRTATEGVSRSPPRCARATFRPKTDAARERLPEHRSSSS